MDIFDSIEMLPVLRIQRPPTTYWLDNFMPNAVNSQAEEVFFDVVMEPRRLAPFVAPNMQGRVMREVGYTTKSFRPAYVKPKHILTPARALPRLAGEPPPGILSVEERFLALVAYNLGLQKQQVMRRHDWMACNAIANGSVTIQDDDYPAVTVDFGRDPSLDIILTGAALWTSTTSTPLSDIDNARIQAFTLSRQPITRLTFGLSAWSAFVKNAGVLQTLNDFFRGSASVFNTVTSEPGPYEFKGVLGGPNGAGNLQLWTYNDQYEDNTGATQLYLPDNVVVGTGPGIDGFRLFGAIADIASEFVATDMWPKMWDIQDPSVRMMMTQSAPLMVPKQPNNSFILTVC